MIRQHVNPLGLWDLVKSFLRSNRGEGFPSFSRFGNLEDILLSKQEAPAGTSATIERDAPLQRYDPTVCHPIWPEVWLYHPIATRHGYVWTYGPNIQFIIAKECYQARRLFRMPWRGKRLVRSWLLWCNDSLFTKISSPPDGGRWIEFVFHVALELHSSVPKNSLDCGSLSCEVHEGLFQRDPRGRQTNTWMPCETIE